MSVKNFRFVSPGVFVNEVDNSQLPASPAGIGPVVIGRAEKGPALRPTTVDSFSEFVQVFGTPSPGNAAGDVWRRGSWNETAPTYGVYAAQAYLRNSSPLTYIRLLGSQAPASDIEVAAGEAGWDGGTNGKAWALVVFEPKNLDGNPTTATGSLEGSLAAIWYTTDSATTLQLSGAIATQIPSAPGICVWSSGKPVTGSNVVVADSGTPYEFKLLMHNPGGEVGTGTLTTSFNFDIDSSRYIRKIFNTTPARTNAALVETESNYFLGETFDRHLRANVPATAGATYASIVEIDPTSTGFTMGDNYRVPVQAAETPFILGCDLSERGLVSNTFSPEQLPALFKVVALDQPGDWSNRNLKVSIQDITISTNETNPYGTFSLVVRSLSDSDNVVRVVESFTGLDLNPDSLNYIARKIGDRYNTWDATERRYVEYGDYPNVSKYVRVSVNEEIVGDNASLLPFGFRGLLKYDDDSNITGSTGIDGGAPGADTTQSNWLSGSAISLTGRPDVTVGQWGISANVYTTGSMFIVSGSMLTASVFYPAPEFRISASAGNLSNNTDAYFGLQTTRTAGGTVFDHSSIDTLRPRGGMVDGMFGGPDGGATERSMYFTLDDISGSAGIWLSGSHAAGTSLTNFDGAVSGVLDAGFDRFTVPMYGGFDGVNIRELDPFANRNVSGTPSDANNYVFNSIRQSIDSISDPEVVEMNLAAIPGLTQPGLTNNLINVCEDRADALAIIDLEGGYSARAEGKVSVRNNTLTGLNSTITSLRQRALNTSYGCCFYPWLRARDTINGASVWLPPSVAALGTFSSSQKKTQVWFAPAGFNRGGLTEGAAGIPITDVAHKLTRKNRDDLYTANINPIAKFPAEGIVIFGQKTLMVTPSALDRINVRRLMIFVKKRVSQAAATLLFDPNVQTTWNRFISAVTPILSDIKTNFGLSDFKLILDETTTTPELLDRNIMYARIFLKPTRAIEYIAIDFNITRTGASFDD